MDKIEERKEYYDNGNIKLITRLKNGLRHGLRESFYPNGNIKGKVNYKDGKNSGLTELYNIDNYIELKYYYTNDEKDRYCFVRGNNGIIGRQEIFL